MPPSPRWRPTSLSRRSPQRYDGMADVPWASLSPLLIFESGRAARARLLTQSPQREGQRRDKICQGGLAPFGVERRHSEHRCGVEKVKRDARPAPPRLAIFRNGLDYVSNAKYPSGRNSGRISTSVNGPQHLVREQKEYGRPYAPRRPGGPCGNYLRGGRSTPKGRRLAQQSLPRK